MKIIAPLTIVPSMVMAGTDIPALDTGEVAWASGLNATVGMRRVYEDNIYECVGAVNPSTINPLDDTTNWLLVGPTNRMRPFDYYSTTYASKTTSLTYVLQPGFANALAAYGLDGTNYELTVKDAPGGSVIFSRSGSLYENAVGLYELLFAPLGRKRKIVFTNIPINPSAEFTLTITNVPGATAKLGTLILGNIRSLYGEGRFGGTEYGAEAEPVSYSYIKSNDDGTISIKRRYSATGLRATVTMVQDQADGVLATLQEFLDVPVSCIATECPGYDGLNVFGLISGSMRYETFGTATLTINVKGLI